MRRRPLDAFLRVPYLEILGNILLKRVTIHDFFLLIPK